MQNSEEPKLNNYPITEMPIITKKFLLIFWGVITIFLAGVIGWQFGWKTLEKNIYQRGFQEGQTAINNLIMQNLIQFGALQINVPNQEGEIQAIILVPQQIPQEENKEEEE